MAVQWKYKASYFLFSSLKAASCCLTNRVVALSFSSRAVSKVETSFRTFCWLRGTRTPSVKHGGSPKAGILTLDLKTGAGTLAAVSIGVTATADIIGKHGVVVVVRLSAAIGCGTARVG